MEVVVVFFTLFWVSVEWEWIADIERKQVVEEVRAISRRTVIEFHIHKASIEFSHNFHIELRQHEDINEITSCHIRAGLVHSNRIRKVKWIVDLLCPRRLKQWETFPMKSWIWTLGHSTPSESSRSDVADDNNCPMMSTWRQSNPKVIQLVTFHKSNIFWVYEVVVINSSVKENIKWLRRCSGQWIKLS